MKDKTTTKVIDKIAYIKIHNQQILSTRSKGKTKYYIPGGKREPGESDEATLIREISEELSVQIIPSTIKYMGTFTAQADSHPDGVLVKMTCYYADYHGALKAASEIEEIRWLNYKDQEFIAPVDEKIFQFLKDKGELA